MTNPLIDCRYLLEVESGPRGATTFKRAALLPHVNAYDREDHPATDFEWTLGETPIIDHSGIRQVPITISGRSGAGTIEAFDRKGARLTASGPNIITELRAFIADFLAEAERADRAGGGKKDVRLVFRALAEGDHYYVEPLPPIRWHRDTQTSRFSWTYTLQLRGYGEAKPRPAAGVPAPTDVSKAVAAQGLLDTILNFLGDVVTLVTSVRRYADRFVLGPIVRVQAIATQIRNLAAAVGSVVAIPTDVVVACLDVVAGAVSALGALLLALPLGERGRAEVREWFFDAAGALGEMRRGAIGVLGQWRIPVSESTASYRATPAGGSPRSSLGVTDQGNRSTVNALPYVVRSGQSVASIASLLLGDPSLVAAILALNGMVDPFTMSDGSPFGPGVTLLLPQVDGVALQAGTTGAASADDIYGTDLLLTRDGDLVCPGDEPTDFALASGIPLLKQALSVRLRTVQGQHGVWPAYGLIPTIGEPTAVETAGRIAASVRGQILRDGRIAEVQPPAGDDFTAMRGVVVEDRGDAYLVRCLAVPRAGPSIDLVVPVAA